MGSISKVHKFSGGRLIAAPNNLADPANNCGGTLLGTVQHLNIRISRRLDPIVAEEFGMSFWDAVALDSEITLNGTFTTWDEDAAHRIFLGATTGSGTPVVTETDDDYVGKLVGATENEVLLWLPNNDTADPAAIFYRPVLWSSPKPIFFSGRKALIVGANWICSRDSQGRKFKSDLLANLSL